MNTRRKILLHICFFFVVIFFGVTAQAQGVPTFDAASVAQSSITAQQSLIQTQQQMQQLQNQIQNTANPNSFVWDHTNQTVGNEVSNLNTLNAYKQQAGGLNSYLNQFSNANQYQSTCIGSSNCTDAQIQQLNASQYNGIAAQKIANDNMLLNVDTQQQQLQADASNLIQLQQNAQSSTGQMQAMQAGNQLVSNQAAQLMQIRTLLVAQQTAEATRAETASDQEAKAQAAHDAFVGTQPAPSPAYNITSYGGGLP